MSLSFRGWDCSAVFFGEGKRRAVKHKTVSSSFACPEIAGIKAIIEGVCKDGFNVTSMFETSKFELNFLMETSIQPGDINPLKNVPEMDKLIIQLLYLQLAKNENWPESRDPTFEEKAAAVCTHLNNLRYKEVDE